MRHAIILLVLLAVACKERPAALPAGGGVLVVDLTIPWEADLVSPRQEGFASAVESFVRDQLVRFDEQGNIEPLLAESFLLQDGGRWSFQLNPDATFASGRAVHSADVVASLEAAAIPGVQSISAMGPSTVQVVSRGSTTAFLVALAGLPISPRGQATRARLPLHQLDGSSAFRVLWADSPVVGLGRRADFRDPVRLEGVVLRSGSDPRRAWADLVAGETDYAPWVAVEHFEALRGVKHLREFATPSPFVTSLVFNCKDPRLADSRVRRALNHAVDRTRLVERYLGGQGRAAGGFNEDPFDFDPRRSVRLLEEAGWKLGPDKVRRRAGVALELEVLTFEQVTVQNEMLTAVAAMLADVGVMLTVRMTSPPELQARLGAGNFQLVARGLRVTPAPYVFDVFRPEAESLQGAGKCGTAESAAILTRVDADPSPEVVRDSVFKLAQQAKLAPPALFVWREHRSGFIHRRFEGVPAGGQSVWSALGDLHVPPGEQLPRDRLEAWRK